MGLPFARWIRLIEEISGHTLDNAFPGITGFRIIERDLIRDYGHIREVEMIIYTSDAIHKIGHSISVEDRTPMEFIARSLIRRALVDYPVKTESTS